MSETEERRDAELIPGYASLDILSQLFLGYPNLRNLYWDIRLAQGVVFPDDLVQIHPLQFLRTVLF